jgi:Protein of unknown function (DUF1559)
MKQIALALHNYAEDHDGRFPPAALNDGGGRPLHSWRVLILPYLEQDALYKEFRLDEPWDSPHNAALLPRMPKVYSVPDRLPVGVGAGMSDTFIQVFVGPGTAFEGPRGLSPLRGDFPDGLSNTVLLVEAREAVPWTEPADLAYEPDRALPPLGGVFTGRGRFSLFGPNRSPGFHVAMGDASVRFLGPQVSEATLRNAITRNDGQTLGPDW